jgi:aldehyde dehydrogenase (NAD+)
MAALPEFKNVINGELRGGASGRMIDSINPATGEVWARYPASDVEDAQDAVEAAKAAFPAWSATTAPERCAYLEAAAEIFVEHGEEIATIETTDNGNPLPVSRAVYGGRSAQWMRPAYETLHAVTGRSVPLGGNLLGLTLREPYGVVAAIVPFNMPAAMLNLKAAAALAAGNTVVIKPPEQASASMLRLGELLNQVFPPGVVNVVSGHGEVGEAFVRHRDVAKITMTGSTPTAKRIQAAAADTLTPSVFELGGKSPNIVFADADLDAAAIGTTLPSIFNFNAGQACVAGSRILVQRPVLDEMLQRIEGIVRTIKVGDPLDPTSTMGPLISREQYDRVVGFIEIGSKEADIVFGGRHGADVVPSHPGGYWVEPTLLLTSDSSLSVCREEIFGPVAVVIPFDTEEEAIAIANDTQYGLASGVWTNDNARIYRMMKAINAGSVWVNTYMHTRYELPFSGFKQSGYGLDEVLEFTREKAVVVAMGPRADVPPIAFAGGVDFKE